MESSPCSVIHINQGGNHHASAAQSACFSRLICVMLQVFFAHAAGVWAPYAPLFHGVLRLITVQLPDNQFADKTLSCLAFFDTTNLLDEKTTGVCVKGGSINYRPLDETLERDGISRLFSVLVRTPAFFGFFMSPAHFRVFRLFRC